jgi:hypothetical protein
VLRVRITVRQILPRILSVVEEAGSRSSIALETANLSRRLSNRFPGIDNSYICGDLKTDHARKEGCGGGFLGQEAPFTAIDLITPLSTAASRSYPTAVFEFFLFQFLSWSENPPIHQSLKRPKSYRSWTR